MAVVVAAVVVINTAMGELGCSVLRRNIVSCRFFLRFRPGGKLYFLVFTTSARSAEQIAFYRFFYDFSARSTEKNLWAIFSARSADKSFGSIFSAQSAERSLSASLAFYV